MRHKFNAKPTIFKDKKYSSKLEAKYAQKLDMAQKSGELVFWLEQVPVTLPGGLKYVLDFMEFWASKNNEPGEIVFTECKGYETPEWKIKHKLFIETHPYITLNIVRK